jgi:hypothetical protein
LTAPPPRLASGLLVSALLRQAEIEGGFGAVLAKGDEQAGAIGVVLLERGGDPRFLERSLDVDGLYRWRESPGALEGAEGWRGLVERRRRFDPDMWIIELDIPSGERFAAEMNSIG